MEARAWLVIGIAGAAAAGAVLWFDAAHALALPRVRFGEFAGLMGAAGLGAAWLVRRGDAATAVRSTTRRPVLQALVLAAFAVLLYGWVLRQDFFADDFFNLTLAVEHGLDLYRPQPGWHHFFPLGMDLNAAPYYLAGWRPMWFHAHQLAVAWLVAVSVAALAGRWGLDVRAALVAGVLWFTFPLQVEGIAWINILQYTYSTLFAILAVLAFTRYTDGGHVRAIAACAGFTALSMLCLEQGAVIGLLCIAAALLRPAGSGRRPRAQLLAAAVAPCLVAGLLLLWKRLGAGQLGYQDVGVADWLRTWSAFGWSVCTPGSSFGLHLGLALGNRGSLVALLSGLGVLGLFVAAARRGSPARQLGICWVVTGGLPIVFGSPSIGSRHYLLPAVGVALALAAWWGEAGEMRPRRARGWVLACLCVWGAWWIRSRQPAYDGATVAVRAVREGIGREIASDVPYDRIALVDLPWSVGGAEWPVLTFSTGARVLTGWVRGDHDLETVRAVRVWRTGPAGHTASEAEFVDAETLAAAAADPEQVVLQWNAAAWRLERLGPAAP